MGNEIKTTKIEASLINAGSLLINGDNQSDANNKDKKASAQIWGQTLILLKKYHGIKFSSYKGEDVKKVSEDLKITYTAIMGPVMPATGLNVNGKEVTLQNDDGSYKFRSYPSTKVSYGYTSDLAKVLVAGVEEEVILGENEVLPRNAALKLAKIPETPLQTISRCLDMAEQKLEGIPSSDRTEVDALLAKFEKAWAARCASM